MTVAALEAAKMRQSSGLRQQSEEKHIKEFSRRTQRKFATEEKMRIVLAGLRGEAPVAELCRREGAAESPCCCWSKESLEAGMWRLASDTARGAMIFATLSAPSLLASSTLRPIDQSISSTAWSLKK